MSTESMILVRYGEIFLKGDNRHLFQRQLLDNVRKALTHAGLSNVRVERPHGRIIVWPPAEDRPRALRALERVFGLASLSPAQPVERSLEAISAAAIEAARAAVANRPGRSSFKVESRRTDKHFLPSSPELSRLVGAAIVGALGLPVDVHQPSFTVGVEVGFERAFVFAETSPGPGGLPIGSSGRVELLLSGGIDSPAAGWLMQKRGCVVGATYFHSFPYTGDKSKDKVVRLARKLAAWQLAPVRLAVVPFTDAQKAFKESCDPRLLVVLYRRLMLRVAERIARAAGAQALVTGEALGQVASQTLENMSVIGAACSLPLLRPCVGHDKQETIALARRIDTYETSIEPYDDCCSLFVPDHPETKARAERVHAAEARVDLAALADACLAGVETIECMP